MEEFNLELQALLKKYDRVLGTQAFLTPDGRISSKPVFVDAAKMRSAQTEAEKQGQVGAPPTAPPEPEGEGVVS